jgi:hypothetical protein
VISDDVQSQFIEHWKGVLDNKNPVYRGIVQTKNSKFNQYIYFNFTGLKNLTSYDFYIVESSDNPDKWQANWGIVKKLRVETLEYKD